MPEPAAKKIELEQPQAPRYSDLKEPLPSTPDKHASFDVIDEAIRIKVGEGEQSKIFDIHKGLLKHYSGYFQTVIKNIEEGRFAEAVDGVISLPEERVDTFTCFRNWLYSADHRFRNESGPLTDLHDQWCFADRRNIPMLMNRVVDIAITRLHDGLRRRVEKLEPIYTSTRLESRLRQLVAFQFAMLSQEADHDREKWTSLAKKEWSAEFAVDMAMIKLCSPPFDEQEKLKFDRCQFHEHENGARCEGKGWKAYV